MLKLPQYMHQYTNAVNSSSCQFLLPTKSGVYACLQEFNRGLFDFLIATDDPARQEEGKAAGAAAEPAADQAADPAASLSQQAGQESDPNAAEDQDQDQEPDHPWAESAAQAQSLKVSLCFLRKARQQEKQRKETRVL